MERKSERDDPSVDVDGVRLVYEAAGSARRRSASIIIALAATAGLAVLMLTRTADRPTDAAVPSAGEPLAERPLPRVIVPRAAPPRVPVAGHSGVRRRPMPDTADRRAPRAHAAAAGDDAEDTPEDIDARDYIAALRDDGATEGLAAFPPPGTRPPRAGVIVPADYVLPEGFARHYQSTDDGRRLAPILAIAPGYDLLDDAGEPVPLTDGRIVPPEFAPPDLTVQMLEVPTDQDPGADTP